jgi:hypothetical protein
LSRIIAIDPGSAESAWVRYRIGAGPEDHGTGPNREILHELAKLPHGIFRGVDAVVIEWMQPRGMPTSAQEFETLWWVGRFTQAAIGQVPVYRLPRLRVKVALTGRSSANDANIRAALIDRFGGAGGKRAAIGLKASPGPLYGITGDEWAALGVAVGWELLELWPGASYSAE